MQRNELAVWNKLKGFCKNSESIRINVFTSSSCTFCNEALIAAEEVAKKFHQFDFSVEVVETCVEDKPDIVEALNVIALPMILVGKSQIVGLPHSEDIELLLHQTMLGGEN